ncbi:hypothetical protein FGG08_002088 [Glutinoglossum americanum]|uniref:Uncharacterized protein n=1 Tax=Glutinoglossum americanum TaxID=1670608 RepID=A0A9P8I716_9PEZI|nr:hypothetical protein FGG08_002088 [Glutinoglossum americanum]
MHFNAKVSVLLMAAVASASPAQPGRRDYGYYPHPPAHSNETSVVDLPTTVTVLPIASSIGTGYSLPTTTTEVVGPIATGVTNYPTGTESGVVYPVPTTNTKVTAATLTYTQGTGASATVVTTTVMRTFTEIEYYTVFIPDGGKHTTDAALPVATHDSLTTTISSTSTFTTTITVFPVDSTDKPVYGADVTAAGVPTGGCASPVTVTVTAPGSTTTVTVTASPEYANPMTTASEVEPVLTSSKFYGNGTSTTTTMPGSMKHGHPHSSGHIPKPIHTLPTGYFRV